MYIKDTMKPGFAKGNYKASFNMESLHYVNKPCFLGSQISSKLNIDYCIYISKFTMNTSTI